MILFSLFSSLTLAYIVWWFVSLVTNYRAAKKMGFPILISPISALSVFP